MRFCFAGPSPASSRCMRPLSRPTFDRRFRCSSKVLRRRLSHGVLFVLAVGAASGCSQSAATGGAPPPPPPPPSIEVSVTPQSENVTLGNSQLFLATLSNTSNSSVSWSVNGVAGGNSVDGVIDSTGMYTAPADLPSPATDSRYGNERGRSHQNCNRRT